MLNAPIGRLNVTTPHAATPLFEEGWPETGHAHSAPAPTSEVELRYEHLARDPRFFQFANIPDRIIKCLKFYGIDHDEFRVRSALLAYYIFIGVTDEVIDSQGDDGKTSLACSTNPSLCLNVSVACSDAEFMAEILKQYFPAGASQQIRAKFRTLYRINFAERQARTLTDFLKSRKLLGRVTADISYLLIRDHLRNDGFKLRQLMREVGAVGCLIDSLVDARDDQRAGALTFRPSFSESLRLAAHTLALGTRLGLRHLGLLSLFAQAFVDNIRDRRRSLTFKH